MNKNPLPEPTGIDKTMFIDNNERAVSYFSMREGNSTVGYVFFRKPNTDFGITASVRRIK